MLCGITLYTFLSRTTPELKWFDNGNNSAVEVSSTNTLMFTVNAAWKNRRPAITFLMDFISQKSHSTNCQLKSRLSGWYYSNSVVASVAANNTSKQTHLQLHTLALIDRGVTVFFCVKPHWMRRAKRKKRKVWSNWEKRETQANPSAVGYWCTYRVCM